MLLFRIVRLIVACLSLNSSTFAIKHYKKNGRKSPKKEKTSSTDREYPGPNFEWMAPEEGQIRGPCPVLNSLANHGLINRSGVNVPVEDIVAAASEFIDMNPQHVLDGPIRITRSLGINQVLANGVEVITLSDLFFHNIIEKDSSLVRPDNGFGIEEAKNISPASVIELLSMHAGEDFLDRGDLLQYQKLRIQDSLANNPTVSFTEFGRLSLITNLVFVLLIGQAEDFDQVSKLKLLTLFVSERIPSDYVPFSVSDPEKFNPILFPNSAVYKYEFSDGSIEQELSRLVTEVFDELVPSTSLVAPAFCDTCGWEDVI